MNDLWIKFKLEKDIDDKDKLDVFFKKISYLLNIQLDENLNPYRVDNENYYILKNVSNENNETIEEKINEFFNHNPSDIVNKPLYEFLILETNNKLIILTNINSNLFDYISINKIYDIFNKSYELEETEDYMNVNSFYESMLADSDQVGILLDCIRPDGPGNAEIDLNIDNNVFNSFLNEHMISKNIVFTSVFAYTLSRFVGRDTVLFNVLKNDYDYLDNGCILPMLFDCKNREISSFMKYMSNSFNVMRYTDYPLNSWMDKYGIESRILFQFTPDFIKNNIENHNSADFNVKIIQKGNYYKLNVTYSDKYSSELVERFINTYYLILQEILNAKELSDINYTLTSDLKILDKYNKTETKLKYNNILQAFNETLRKYQNNTLVIDDDTNYTYSESAYLINLIKSLLKTNNICENETITVFVDRNHWTLFTALSCLSLNITYVPIDENHPDKHIAFMIQQSGSKSIITTNTFETRVINIIKEFKLKLNIINVSSLENNENISYLENDENIPYVDYVNDSSNDIACILYTSGTTGTPKSVQMTKLGIINLIEYYIESTKFTKDDVIGIFSSVGFDVSLEQFASIFTGGAVTYVPNDIRVNIKELNQYFIKHNVTHTLITTQISKLFIKNVTETSLKYLQAAGEKLGSITLPNDYILSDVYGPTEANYITSIDVDKKIDKSSVGFLNWNVKTYILDNELRRVPFGAVGELYISGYQTTKGYFNNPDANKKSLFNNPYDGEIKNYEKMYKTGDLCRYLPDGSVGIVGRADSQVKIMGNRVELSEIEVTIRNMDYINDVTVQTIKNRGTNELVAYIVLNKNFKGDANKYIKDYLSEHKPKYMVPSYVIELNKIPVNVNGKVDSYSLPEVNLDDLRAEYIAPTNC